MILSAKESILIIAVCALTTFFLRAFPFLIFGSRPVPKVIRYIGGVLPMAVMATLVIYCIRGIRFDSSSAFLPELISIGVVVALHLWRKNVFISILGGTVCYMLLVQFVFL